MKRILIPAVILMLLAVPVAGDHPGDLPPAAQRGLDSGGMDSGSTADAIVPGNPGSAPVNLTDAGKIQEEADRFGSRLSGNMTAYSGDLLDVMVHDRDLRVAAFTIGQAASVTTHGTTTWLELWRISTDVNSIADRSLENQHRILWRNPVIRGLFGGDREASAALEQDAADLLGQAGRLEELMTALNFNQEIKPLIVRQIVVLRNESVRLVHIAERDKRDRGLLGIFS